LAHSRIRSIFGIGQYWPFCGITVASISVTSQSIAKVNTAFTPEQLPIEYRRYADAAKICHGKIVGDCIRGDLVSESKILVLGDSHAAILNHFFDYLGAELGFKARIITASSCIPIPGFDYQRIAKFAQKSRLDQIRSKPRKRSLKGIK
tara:strand:- start:9067 stop:9513 length:447 start_codon:yes stop_codon:yes gene_type:complete